MLDVQFIRDNKKLVEEKSKQKGIKVDLEQLLGFDSKRRELLLKVEELRAQRNKLAESTKGKKPDETQVKKGRELKDKLADQEHQLGSIEKELNELLLNVPNVTPDDTPLGGEEANREEKKWGEAKSGEGIKDHLTWAEERGLIDFERGAKVAGAKFYFTKGSLVELELALFQFCLAQAVKKGFMPMTVPHLVNSSTASGTGFLPRGEERQIYKIEGEDLNLIATAEIPITGYHSDEILDQKQLPALYAGLSPAYRMEAGAYGKHSKGLYRVHQFNKLELYVFCEPKDSEAWHKKLVDFEEEICQSLELPYRLVRIASGDLGAPAYKKYDIEYWSPPDQNYRELMSCSNVTDYQTRRLNIRYRSPEGKTAYLHSLNGTAAAFSRMAIAIIENYQTKDGKVEVPKILIPFMGGKTEL